ncbi:hypothetical protein NLJ89_g10901 [Agrocybe chaxingu]|uniref:Uncharacterized protein n=1 Tax=Agrocybe chaxingu TaxID=84603 RepID=A0A9W8MQG7_9AGAR|nr:hypothetical protein NLJ89_g10901 [Agrocybe chaxingu]
MRAALSKSCRSSNSRAADPIAWGTVLPPPRPSSRSAKMTYASHPELYTQNDLNTFSFGAPHPTSPASLSPSVDPLSRNRDETDSDEVVLISDTTPRPSVVGQHPRSHQSHPSLPEDGLHSLPPPRRKQSNRAPRTKEKSHDRDSDAASVHTFGTSSASASVSSLSRPSRSNSRARSRKGGYSSTTPQTSATDMTSDEDDMDRRHPLPPEPLDPSDVPPRILLREQESTLYLSEEDFDGYADDDDNDNDGIEIESAVHDASDWGTFLDYRSSSRESIAGSYSQRRGSIPVPIPHAPSDRYLVEHRARENSLATLRRPSRSLEDLHSFSFAQASGSPSSAVGRGDDRPLPPAPTSVPESEGDWRDLRKRSIQRDKDLPPITIQHSASATTPAGASSSKTITANCLQSSNGFSVSELDTSWMQYGVNGLVGFNMDEVADIVGEGGLNGRRPSAYSFRKGSAASTFRRHSTISNTNVDIMHRNILVWGNQRFLDQRHMWTFKREVDRVDNEHDRRQNAHPDRERPSISTLFNSRPSTATVTEGAIPSFLMDGPPPEKEKKPSSKDKSQKEPWRGMALDSEEIWHNGASGKFRITRKNATCASFYLLFSGAVLINPLPALEAGKPPQQRLNVSYIRSPYISNATNRDTADGPAVTIHKHSKAGAFSISRHYRTRSTATNDTTTSLRNASSRISSKDSQDGNRKKANNMILLAPRRVQKAYTSTNTTRKLESHGLLDDSGRPSPKDADRMKRERDHERRQPAPKDKEREQRRETERRRPSEKDRPGSSSGKAKENATAVASSSKMVPTSPPVTKPKDIPPPKKPMPDNSEGSSAVSSLESRGNVKSSTAATTPDQSEDNRSFGSVEQQSVVTLNTTSSDRTISQDTFYSSYRRRGSMMDGIEDDSDDERPRYPTRTPYRETYAALPPEVFEMAHQEHPSHGLFSWGKTKSGEHGGPRAYLEASYKPPWAVTAPRFNSETRKGIVDDLNMSFQDVGLLPAIGEIKGSSHSGQNKRKREQQQAKPVRRNPDKQDIFEDIPPDALYMLLPLWPGETDAGSNRKYPFIAPSLPTHTRQYLLIYYMTPPTAVPRDDCKTKSGEKKRSRNSPTSSHDSINRRDDRSVFLSTFHISARVVSYRDMQGSGVRIPDVGLAVSGPLQDAYESMPHPSVIGSDYVIGVCHSREAGIEFVPEGFEKMGLSHAILNPRTMEENEDDDTGSMDTISVLTPIGRAVMEMAWLGSLAVTSFNPNP